jgi:hypothetical protein
MSRYRKVLSRIWTDDKFLRFSDQGKLLFVHHLTSDRANPFLLYIEGPGAICDYLGWSTDTLTAAAEEIVGAGLVRYARDGSNLVFVPNALKIKENAPESPNARKTWLNLVADLPRTEFFLESLRHWQDILGSIDHPITHAFIQVCTKAYLMPTDKTNSMPSVGHNLSHNYTSKTSAVLMPKPMTNPIQEQEQEQEQEKEPPLPPVGGRSRQPRTSPEESKRIAEEAMDLLELPKFREKYPHLDIDHEHSTFKNHHLARPGNFHGAKRVTDWNKAFHNWCNADWKKPKDQETCTPSAPKGGWFE